MAKRIDITGQRHAHLTVLRCAERYTKNGKLLWECQCDCGKIVTIRARDFHVNQSCGCLKKSLIGDGNRTHGMSKHPAYGVWHSMVQRCTEPTHQAWKNYGGRGIQVCERWLHSFENFWEDMGSAWKKGMELDRINNMEGYSPENCRWTTRKVNARNKRVNRVVDSCYGRMCLGELSERCGIRENTLHYRLTHGWPEKSLHLKPDYGNRCMTSGTVAHGISSVSAITAS